MVRCLREFHFYGAGAEAFAIDFDRTLIVADADELGGESLHFFTVFRTATLFSLHESRGPAILLEDEVAMRERVWTPRVKGWLYDALASRAFVRLGRTWTCIA